MKMSKKYVEDIKDMILDAFDTEELVKDGIVVIKSYLADCNDDFVGKYKDLEVVYEVVLGAQAIQNNFDIKSDKKEYIEALKNLKDKYKEYLKEEIEMLTKYFA